MARAYYPRCRVALQVLLEDFDGGSSNDVVRLEVIPRRVEIIRNDHRTADQVRVELDYRDLPLDPRTARSILIGVGLVDTGDPKVDVRLDDPNALVFVGYIDVPECVLADTGEIVKLEGRDYTALLLDHPWRDGLIDISGSLEQVVQALLAAVPGASDIPVNWVSRSQTVRLADIVGKTKWAARNGDDAWTVLVELMQVAGLIPTMVLDTLEIRAADDFGSRLVALTYGVNVSRLMFRRNQAEFRTYQIRVNCWNEATGQALTATYPTEPVVVRKRVSPDGQVKTDAAPLIHYAVAGAYTQEQLDAVARGIYEEAAREQVEGEIETREMADITGTLMPLLGNGDALLVELGKVSDLSTIQGMSESQAVATLVARGMAASVAALLVGSWTRAQALQTTFYLRRVTHRWSRDDGYAFTGEFINYVLGSGE